LEDKERRVGETERKERLDQGVVVIEDNQCHFGKFSRTSCREKREEKARRNAEHTLAVVSGWKGDNQGVAMARQKVMRKADSEERGATREKEGKDKKGTESEREVSSQEGKEGKRGRKRRWISKKRTLIFAKPKGNLAITATEPLIRSRWACRRGPECDREALIQSAKKGVHTPSRAHQGPRPCCLEA
jgi:hypothetical protein